MTALDALLHDRDVAQLAAYVRAHPGRTIAAYGDSRFAAIALIIRQGADGKPELLLIRRAEWAGDPWSGHIACPGGRMEPGDRNLEATAARETLEETGIDLVRDGRMLGTFDDVAPRSRVLPSIIIRPYLAIVASPVHVALSDEVADAFWVPMEAIRRDDAWGVGTVRVRETDQDVPIFRYAQATVWGLTERVLHQLFDVLVRPED